MAFHFTNRTGDLHTYIDGREPDLGVEGGVFETPDEVTEGDESVALHSSAQSLVRFGHYYRHLYRYLAANLRPDRMEVTHHRESKEKKNDAGQFVENSGELFYGGTPWDASFSIDPDSLAYSEGHNYEGEMAGAILRFSRYILDPTTPAELSTHFATNASTYITAMNDNLLAKWINAAQLYTGSSDLFYGASQSNCLLGIGNLNDGHIWRYTKSRTGSMFLHARGLSGITPAYSNFSDAYCDYYHTKIADAFVPQQYDGRDTWQWYDGAGWWETYDNGIMDAAHYAGEVRHVFMADEYGFPEMGDIGSKIADNFVNAMWNRVLPNPPENLVDLYEFRHPNEKHKLSDKGNSYGLTDYPLLAKYNFTVWEILNDFYARKPMHLRNYAPASAQMAYAVRYGTPRNLRAEPLTV
ncbi:MAG: hypothetical protein M5R41_15260 [Bacteroidia bacterium]|nr:hypothetical protein [Bacteroidia bacterium]